MTIRLLIALIIALGMVAMARQAQAVDPEIMLADPALEARAKALTQQLRCPTCVSQSVDSSNVGISRDLQLLVRDRIVAGDTDREILDYVASRYGDFVLLRPRVGGANIVLWSLPILVFFTAIAGLIAVKLRARESFIAAATLDDDERAEIDGLTNMRSNTGSASVEDRAS